MMDIYEDRYFVINKRLLTSFGLWPYQHPVKKLVIRSFLITLMFAASIPQIYGLYVNFGKDVEKIIEHIGIMFYIYGIQLKFITTILAEKRLKSVYQNVAENWLRLQKASERRILIDYSEKGRTLTIGYIIYMTSALLLFVTMPMSPKLLHLLRPPSGNETVRRIGFILNGAFPMDPYKHYFKIYAFDCLYCCASVFALCSIDSTYAACIEHCLSLFAIVKSRLKASTDDCVEEMKAGFTKGQDTAYQLIIPIIKLHKDTIRFTDNLESSYSMSFLFLMGINMIYCSVLSVLIIIKRNDYLERFRYSTILIGVSIHLFYLSWPGQKIIDHSAGLFEDTYMNEWYNSSIKARNLLRFMTLRCFTPCQLTAGGLYVMNFYNFASIVKSSVSYITVFTSFT